MPHSILMHEPDDDVGVAVVDLKTGSEVSAVTLEGEFVAQVQLATDIPLGHKVAMRDIPQGKMVTEYGRTIGQATQTAARGSHVHTHNLKTLRWKT